MTRADVRRLVHRLGYRYRLHVADLRRGPDLVFRHAEKSSSYMIASGIARNGDTDAPCLRLALAFGRHNLSEINFEIGPIGRNVSDSDSEFLSLDRSSLTGLDSLFRC